MLLLITRIEDEDENECREKLEVHREREREREVTPQLLFNHFELTCVEVTNNIFTFLSIRFLLFQNIKKVYLFISFCTRDSFF